MSIEHDLNCAIIAEEDFRDVTALGIKPEFFADPIERRVFELIGDHMLAHRKVPGIDAVRLGFPNYDYTHTPEPVRFYAAAVRDACRYRIIMNGITEMMPMIERPETTGQDLQDRIEEIQYRANLAAAEGAVVDLYSTQLEFFQREYPIRKKQGYLRGISTGFNDLDLATGGWQPGQLITLFGLAKHGKSTLMLASAASAKREHFKPMFVTFEMGTDEMRWRSMSLQVGVSLNGLLHGSLPPPDEQRVELGLKQQGSMFGFTMIEDQRSAYTIAAMNQKIMEVNPDIVFIDGFYWMDSPGEPKSNESLTFLSRHLKQLAQSHKIPVVISTQALPSRSRGGLHAGSVGYSQALQQDSDVLIGVYKETDSLSKYDVLLNRAGVRAACYLRIDWDHGLIEQEDTSVALAEIESSGNKSGGGKNWP